MVSSPVSDLLNESNSTDSTEPTFEEENTITNAEGKTLEIYRFLNDGVKMVSVNGFSLPLDSLLDMVGLEPTVADYQPQVVQDEEFWFMMAFAIIALLMSVGASMIFIGCLKKY